MATNYDLLGTQSSIQVLSPTVTLPTVDATLRTKPSGVIFEYWLAKADWDAGTAPVILEAVAGGVEHIMQSEPVVAAVGGSELDDSGLLAQHVTFTVGYTPPGSNGPPLTIDVDVPVGDFGQDTIAGENFGLTDAHNLIQAQYDLLVQANAG